MLDKNEAESDEEVSSQPCTTSRSCVWTQILAQTDRHEAQGGHQECGRVNVEDILCSDRGDTGTAGHWSNQQADVQRALNECIGTGELRAGHDERNSRCQRRTENCGDDRYHEYE